MENQLQNIVLILEDIKNFLSISWVQWTTVGLSFCMVILLFFYTYWTKRIALASERTLRENMRPLLSCELKSGKRYYSKESIGVNSDLLFDTRFIVVNYSKYNLEVFINTNLEIDGELQTINKRYNGSIPWFVSSFQKINGHLDLSKELDKKPFEELKLGHKSLSLDLEVGYNQYPDRTGENRGKKIRYKNPAQHWDFNFKEKLWIDNNIGIRA